MPPEDDTGGSEKEYSSGDPRRLYGGESSSFPYGCCDCWWLSRTSWIAILLNLRVVVGVIGERQAAPASRSCE